MFNQDIEYVESDNFITNNILLSRLTDQPLVSTSRSVRGTKFSESLTFSFFKEVFLPQGFPKSVHKDYVQYQIWDTLQAFASTINGTLATHSIMRGVGVGESTATPLVAAITWILKDGTGMIGRIIFAWWQGNNLDSQCKKWRLFADVLNDAAMVIEVTVPYTFTFSSYILCFTTGMKAIVGIAGGATRTAIMQHHAIKDNMADVSAKEHSQGTLVNLAGSIVGILILLFVHERLFIFICFILVIVHIICNYFAVTSLQMNTLNEDRLCLIIKDYILYHDISSIESINKRESVFILLQNPAKKIFGFDIESGISFKQVLNLKLIHTKDVRSFFLLFLHKKYLPVMDLKRKKIYVILTNKSCDDDILKAYFHCIIYAMIVSLMIGLSPESLIKGKRCGPSFPIMKMLMFLKRFPLELNQRDLRLSAKFFNAVDEVVSEEYCLFNKLLDDSAWILRTNILPIKPWKGALK